MQSRRNNGRRWIVAIAVLLILALALALYQHRFLSGSVQMDAELVSSENLERLAENWEALVASGRYEDRTSKEELADGVHMLQYIDPNAENLDKAYRALYIIAVDDSAGTVDVALQNGRPQAYARYSRLGLTDAMHGFGAFGECTSRICVSSDHCVLFGIFWETDGTARSFNELVREALEIVGSGS